MTEEQEQEMNKVMSDWLADFLSLPDEEQIRRFKSSKDCGGRILEELLNPTE